jgi:hypothetical protein
MKEIPLLIFSEYIFYRLTFCHRGAIMESIIKQETTQKDV